MFHSSSLSSSVINLIKLKKKEREDDESRIFAAIRNRDSVRHWRS